MFSNDPETLITIVLFAVLYIWFLLYKTSTSTLDVYDLVILSTAAVLPISFILVPGFWHFLSNKIGVAFPFVLLFGILIVIIFITIHRLLVKLYDLKSKYVFLIQELGLLKQKQSSKESETKNCTDISPHEQKS